MSTTILNFKKFEVVKASKKEAEAYVEEYFGHYSGDATQKYNNWKEKQTNGITERSVKEFMLDYLAHKIKNAPGTGFIITLDPAVTDSRQRPYKIEDVKNTEGKRKYKKVYQLIGENGEVLGECDSNKAEAKNLAKEIIKNGYKGKGSCKLAHKVVEGQETVFNFEYAPSKNTKNGTYLVFGIEA